MDIERTIEFILAQQAQFANQMIELSQRQSVTETALASLAQHQVTMQQAIVDIAHSQERANEILMTLAERQVATEEGLRKLEDNVNVLVVTVERHIENHR